MAKYVDIHSHINFPQYDTDRDAVLLHMKEQGIATITVGTNAETSHSAVALATEHEHIYATIGIHPVDDVLAKFDNDLFTQLIENPKVVAIGECGLDYFRLEGESREEKARQKALFEQHIQFALKYDKALMLHCRSSYSDVLDILESYKKEFGEKLRGNSHFFAGDTTQAQRFFDIGFTVSFTGVITFAREYDAVIKYAPLSRIHAETDAPYVAPIPYRGKRNEPGYVVEVVKKIAQIKDISEEIVAKQFLQNTEEIFKVSLG